MEWGNFDFMINIESDVHNSHHSKPKEKVNSIDATHCRECSPSTQCHNRASGNQLQSLIIRDLLSKDLSGAATRGIFEWLRPTGGPRSEMPI